MQIDFLKMQGLGNDFVIIDNRKKQYSLSLEKFQRISNRKIGIGCDQVIVLENSEKCDIFMRIFNANGTEAEMCGNASRCVAKLICEEQNKPKINIETIANNLTAEKISYNEFAINVGVFSQENNKIPASSEINANNVNLALLDLNSNIFSRAICMNVGNPHISLFVKENTSEKEFLNIDFKKIGLYIQNLDLFPKSINVHFCRISSNNIIRAKNFERGSGLTMACGSGACAIGASAIKNNLTENNVIVEMDGGNLKISTNIRDEIIMSGGGELVFKGTIDI